MAGQRSTRLSMLALIQEGILEPGEKLLTFDYMGKRCEADLLPDGLIQWNGSKYSSPYAWASQCKSQVNPDHKSGIGWGHIRYKGIKLSQYKTVYMKKHQLGSPEVETVDEPIESKPPAKPRRRRTVQLFKEEQIASPAVPGLTSKLSPPEIQSHSLLPGDKDVLTTQSTYVKTTVQSTSSSSNLLCMTTTLATPNQLFECSSFSSFKMKQPFSVSLTSNVLMIMDFHCHLDVTEVVGYLGGRYDRASRTLEVVEVFPCKCDVTDATQSKQTEKEVKALMEQKGLCAVGWYHSHPVSEPKPSQSDILCQRSYQEVSRIQDTGEEPCIGIILSPNHGGLQSSPVTEFELFYIIMVQQDGLKASPMKLQFSVVWDNYLTQEVVDEMNSLSSHYKGRPCCPKFLAMWKGEMYFINKFKKSLSEVQPKFPEENSNQTFMTYIDQLLGSEFKS